MPNQPLRHDYRVALHHARREVADLKRTLARRDERIRQLEKELQKTRELKQFSLL